MGLTPQEEFDKLIAELGRYAVLSKMENKNNKYRINGKYTVHFYDDRFINVYHRNFAIYQHSLTGTTHVSMLNAVLRYENGRKAKEDLQRSKEECFLSSVAKEIKGLGHKMRFKPGVDNAWTLEICGDKLRSVVRLHQRGNMLDLFVDNLSQPEVYDLADPSIDIVKILKDLLHHLDRYRDNAMIRSIMAGYVEKAKNIKALQDMVENDCCKPS